MTHDEAMQCRFAATAVWHRRNASLTPREQFRQSIELQKRGVQIARSTRARRLDVPIPTVWHVKI